MHSDMHTLIFVNLVVFINHTHKNKKKRVQNTMIIILSLQIICQFHLTLQIYLHQPSSLLGRIPIY